MTKKQVLRAIAFFVCVAVMVIALCDVFELENTTNLNQRFYTYRSLEKDTVDAVIIGTSGIDRFWIPSKGYEDHGMTVFPLATDAMPAWLYVQAIKDALLYQDLKLIIVDIRSFGQNNLKIDTMDVRARRLLDAMSTFSPYRIEAALKTMKLRHRINAKDASRTDLSYIFSVVKYHTKWADDGFKISENLGPVPHEFLGYYINPKLTTGKMKVKLKGYDPERFAELDPLCEEALYELIEFSKENDIQLLFLDTPQIRGKSETARSNTVYHILEQEGMDYIHYYTPETESGIDPVLGFDFENDYYNTGHVNYYGAVKFTDVFAKYLQENYTFTDYRDNEDVKADWDGIQEKLEKKVKEFEEKGTGKMSVEGQK